MAAEPRELLVHVEPLQEQRQLLLDALALDARAELGEPLNEPRAHARLHLWQPLAHAGDQRLERGATLLEQLAQPRSLTRACRQQVLERRAENGIRHGEQLLAARA